MKSPAKPIKGRGYSNYSGTALSLAAAGLVGFCVNVHAQESDGRLEEVVVTAQKRAQNLNDVGMTVQAISGEAFAEREISSLEDIANAVPGLSFSNNLTGAPVYTLRGVGFYETSLAAYPTTSVYIDEVALPFPMLSSHVAYDLQRLEVLKGPQGTLFGQNSTGGAMNFIAKKPTQTFEAGIKGTYGSFDEVDVEGFVSGPLSDNLLVRLAARTENSSGWQRSVTRNDDNGALDNKMARLIFDYRPTNILRLQLMLNAWNDRSDSLVPQLIAKNTQTGGSVGVPAIDSAPFVTGNARDADWSPGLTRVDNQFQQAALRADVDFSDVTLTSLTSFIDYDQDRRDESDGTPANNIDQISNKGNIESFSQELRLANGDGADLRWVVGLNYSRDTVDQAIARDFSDSSANAGVLGFGYNITNNLYTSNQKMENMAAFGNVEYRVVDRVTLKAGARYTEADRRAEICTEDQIGAPDGFGAFTYDVLLGGAFGPYALGRCLQINTTVAGQTPQTLGGVPVGAPGRFIDTLNEDNVSWTAGLDFAATDDLLLYLNTSRGFKAGSYPTAAATNVFQYLPVTQESVLAYEGGFKFTGWDARLQFNGAVFYYDYEDKQLRAKFVDPLFGILDNLQNVPESSVTGAELEATMLLFDGLTLHAGYTYLDTEIKQFVSTDLLGNQSSFAGSEISYTPAHQAVVDLDYRWDLATDWRAFAGLTANYRSRAFAALNGSVNPPGAVSPVGTIFKIDSYTLLDARIGLESPGGAWRFSVFGKNITDEYYWNNVEAGYDTIGRYAGRPATYGVSFEYNFAP